MESYELFKKWKEVVEMNFVWEARNLIKFCVVGD
jgi:hypothetical protein